MVFLTNQTPSLRDSKKAVAQRAPKLCGLVLGAAVVGLILAPLPVSAGMSSASTSDQQIEYALAAAATARTAYSTYYAAAIDACMPFAGGVEDCVSAFSDAPSAAGDGGREAGGRAPTLGGRAFENE